MFNFRLIILIKNFFMFKKITIIKNSINPKIIAAWKWVAAINATNYYERFEIIIF